MSYHPAVRRDASPAFRLIHGINLNKPGPTFPMYLYRSNGPIHEISMRYKSTLSSFDTVQVSLQHVASQLEAVFKLGTALPDERDEFGNTLIFVSAV